MSVRSAHLLVLSLVLLALTACTVYTPAPVHAPAPPRMEPPPPPPPPPSRVPAVEIGYFHDALDPYGDWIWVSPHGWVWAPGAVDPFWRPYTVGQWVWSDYGWTWVSGEEWGWATYHYGRWARVPRHGWVWVPGTVWGPAWVAWRNGPGVVGWAPLPPEVGFRVGVGIDLGGVDLDIVIRPDWWCFVDEVHIVQPRVVHYAYPVGRNVTVIRRTTRVVRIEDRGGQVYHRGIDRDEVERYTRRPLPRYRVVDRDDDPRGGPGRREEIRQHEVRVWRPTVRETPDPRPPRRNFGNPQGGGPATPPPGRQDRPPEPRERAGREPAPLPPVAPPVERRIEKNWERDWRRLQESRRREQQRRPPGGVPAPPAAAPPPQAPPPPAASSQQQPPPPPAAPPAQRARPGRAAPTAHEEAGQENQEAAENAYQEQQAERARAIRESEKPRPKPPARPAMKVRGKKGKDKKQKEKD